MVAKRYVVASLPGRGQTNPYVDLFYDALAPYGVTLYEEPKLNLEWGLDHFSRIDAIHFHWPEFIWRSDRHALQSSTARRLFRGHVPGAWRFYDALDRIAQSPSARTFLLRRTKRRGVAHFRQYLDAARKAGVTVIWTLHNLESHEDWDAIDRSGFAMLAAHADLVICHSVTSRQAFTEHYSSRAQVVLMPHGNYEGVYPQPRPRDEVLAELGLDPRLPVAGCVGALRTYKGFDVAMAAVQQLQGRVQLLCAGQAHAAFDLPSLRRMGQATGGFAMVVRQLSDQDFADFCAASDVLLFPYRRITGSGALLAALTLGRGVVASDLPYFREVLAGHPRAGVLVAPSDSAALGVALEAFLRTEASQREAAARQLAEQYSWPIVVRPVAEQIGRLRAGRKRMAETSAAAGS